MDRIEKIRKVAQKIEQEKNEKKLAFNLKISDLKSQIKALSPRIKYLLEIGNTLSQNGISIKDARVYVEGEREKSYLEANGIVHNLGFVPYYKSEQKDEFLSDKEIVAIGIEGGGWSGPNFFVNENGEIISKIFANDWGWGGLGEFALEKTIIFKCERFVNEFNEFEQAVFKYVDNL